MDDPYPLIVFNTLLSTKVWRSVCEWSILGAAYMGKINTKELSFWTVSTDVKVWAVSLTAVTLSPTSMTFLTQEMPSLSPRNLNFLHLTQSSPSYLNNDQVHFPWLEMTGLAFHLSWFVDLSLGQHSSQIIDNFGLSCRAGKLEWKIGPSFNGTP